MNIKVTVDYKKGYYDVTGLVEGPNGLELNELRKVISGVDEDGKIKYNYTDKRLIEERKKELRAAIRKIKNENRDFKISKEALKNVDLLMFITLKRWDEQIYNNSNYATKYLMAVLEDFNYKKGFKISKKSFKEKCRRAREKSLKEAGIDITYNVGMIGADGNLSLLDRIIGKRIAKMQQKFLGVKVINKLLVKEINTMYEDRSIYSNIPNTFDIPDDFETRIINKTEELLSLDEPVKSERKRRIEERVAKVLNKEDKSSEEDGLDLDDEDEKIVKNIETNLQEHKERGVFSKQEIEQKKTLERKKRMEERVAKVLNKGDKFLEEDLLDLDEEEEKTIKNIETNLKKDKKNKVFIKQEMEQKKRKKELEQLKIELKNILEEMDSTEEEPLEQKQSKDKRNKIIVASEKIVPIERGVKTGVWTRKINSEDDYINNKKYNPNRRNLKERAIRVAITLIAAGSVAFAAYNANKTGDVFGGNNKVGYETDYTLNRGDVKTPVTVNPSIPAQPKVQIAKKEVIDQKVETKKEKSIEKSEVVINAKTQQKTPEIIKMTEKEKVEKFRQEAVQKYMDAFIIGEKPVVGDMFKGEKFSERPDGSGNIGYFDKNQNYKVEHITIITPEGYFTESTDGNNLSEILSKYPNYTEYSLHFSNSKTGGGLGFVTQAQLEKLINGRVNSIIETKKVVNTKNTIIEEDEQR